MVKYETLKIYRGSILDADTDVIVNAANKTLLGGGGVDGVIHRAAGPDLKKYCATLQGCEPGDAKLSPAFDLPYKAIIHAVGPIWKGGNNNEAETLASAYSKSIEIASEIEAASVAFPALSTGAYSYPVEAAAKVAVSAVSKKLLDHKNINIVCFVCIDRKTESAFRNAIGAMDERF